MTATITSCIRALPVGDPGEPQRTESAELLELTRQPWTMRIGATTVAVRPASLRDLPAVAQMLRRCSARSLLDRYRRGGRPPTAAQLDAELRNPNCYIAFTADGSVVAIGTVARDSGHGTACAEVTVLVEDRWQRRGIGGELVSHLAGVARVEGYTELIAYPATAVAAAQRLMIEVGRTRMVPDQHAAHLHTYLPEGATLGLGTVRQRLAG